MVNPDAYPVSGQTLWGQMLKTYIDGGDALDEQIANLDADIATKIGQTGSASHTAMSTIVGAETTRAEAFEATLPSTYVPIINSAPLARSGQSPDETPVAAGTPSVGVLQRAARADHVHPAPSGLGFGTFLGAPAGRFPLIHLDGTDQTQNWNFRFSSTAVFPLSNYIKRSGSVYHFENVFGSRVAPLWVCGDLTIDAGITLNGFFANLQPGLPICIVSSGTVTINGTISTNGESPAAGAAPVQGGAAGAVDSTFDWAGLGGQTGGTGAGAAGYGTGTALTVWGLGGMGGAGGSANGGATAGGAASGYYNVSADSGPTQYALDVGPTGMMYLINFNVDYPNVHNGPRGALGGLGGAAGAGDGTNNGGSGGGGGGNIIIIAKKIVLGATAVLDASGGNGAPGAGGNAGGGGGGGAGVIALHATELDIDPAAQLKTNPGAGGAGVGTGASGSAGPVIAGISPVIGDPPVPFGLGYGAGKIIMAWG